MRLARYRRRAPALLAALAGAALAGCTHNHYYYGADQLTVAPAQAGGSSVLLESDPCAGVGGNAVIVRPARPKHRLLGVAPGRAGGVVVSEPGSTVIGSTPGGGWRRTETATARLSGSIADEPPLR